MGRAEGGNESGGGSDAIVVTGIRCQSYGKTAIIRSETSITQGRPGST